MIFKTYPRDPKTTTPQRFANKGEQRGNHWICAHVKVKRSFFGSFGRNPDKLSLQQLSKPIILHNLKNQGSKSKL